MRCSRRAQTLTLALALLPASLAAQISDQELFQKGRSAFGRYDFVEGLANLFAYSLRYPVAMQLDQVHRQEVTTAITTADKYLRDIIARERQLEQENERLRREGDEAARVSGLTVQRPSLAEPGKPPSYLMVCRGGGAMAFRLLPSGFGLVGQLLTIEFRRSATAGAESLLPGECSWLDRPIGESEPNRVCQRLESTTFDLSWSVNGSVEGLSSNSAPYVGSLVSNDGTFSFMVFNNGQGCMVQTEPFRTAPKAVRPIERTDPKAVRPIERTQQPR